MTFASLLPAAVSSSFANLNGFTDASGFWSFVEMALRYFDCVFSFVVFGFLQRFKIHCHIKSVSRALYISTINGGQSARKEMPNSIILNFLRNTLEFP